MDKPRPRLSHCRRSMSQVVEEIYPQSLEKTGFDQPEKIRVLHIITRMIVGGAQENTLLTVEGLDKMPEYDVVLMSGIDRGREGELLSRARETTNLVIVPELGRAINPFSDFAAFWKIYRHIRKEKYHIVHTHSSKAGVL